MPIELPTRATLNAEAAQALTRAAVEHAGALGVAVTVVVVDHAREPVALIRMEGADSLTVALASGKARLVAANGTPTHVWSDAFAADPFLASTLPAALDRAVGGAVLFGGGFPLRVEGHVIGGVGVSGGEQAQDVAIARAALTALPQAEHFESTP